MRKSKAEGRRVRHLRVRKKVSGTATLPRMVVFRSLKHIYASLVDDTVLPNKVLSTVSTGSAQFKAAAEGAKGGNVKGAALIGKLMAGKAKELGIEKVVFDRAGYRYCGRIKALADGARQGGLKF